MIEIKSKAIINGSLPNRAFKLVKEWAELHEDELIRNFDEAQKPNPKFKLVEPLK
jgi:hypothetical protein